MKLQVFGEKSESTKTDSHSVDLMGGLLFFDEKESIDQVLEHLSVSLIEWLCFLLQHCGAATTKGSRQQMVWQHVCSLGHYSSLKA